MSLSTFTLKSFGLNYEYHIEYKGLMKGNTLRAARLTVGGKDFVHICIFMEFGIFFFLNIFMSLKKRRIGDKLFSVSFLGYF